MITGSINRRHEAIVSLQVIGANGKKHDVETTLDTGFTGSLTLPSSLIQKLDLTWRSRSSAILANGIVEECDVYVAAVNWNGQTRSILVEEMDNEPLLGMALLVGHDLRARVIAGGTVEIESVS